MSGFFHTTIEYLKGVGPQRGALLNKYLEIFTYADLIQHYPFRYEDRTKFFEINEIREDMPYIQIKGIISHIETIGSGRKQRLVATFSDKSGDIELVWFQGIKWVTKKLKAGIPYVVFGKPVKYGQKFNITHPEIEVLTNANEKGGYLQPVYSSSDKLTRSFLDSKGIVKLQRTLIEQAAPQIREILPPHLIEQYRLISKRDALVNIHFPQDHAWLKKALFRLKFEELFYVQLRLLKLKLARMDKFKGQVFNNTDLLTSFYKEHIPFELTSAQKRVVKEAYTDIKSGKQMNRLMQGDVGSGKTMVAFICMLIVIGSGGQATMMAPTEILAGQHYTSLKKFAEQLGIGIAKLTGSTPKKERNIIHKGLTDGSIQLLVGTHALLEDVVQFKNLGIAIIDEQHRFGVAQRAKLWSKSTIAFPHILVMTATPIPRTLAMTLYGDLDVSAIDELPKGRKPIQTAHYFENKRLGMFGFLKKQIERGRQVYIVYPLIDESEKLDIIALKQGFESISRQFPEYHLSIVHGKMKPKDKDFEMQRFLKKETQIMVATTVIEVGVDVPNASVIVIENTERFGLSQLHQLRGRVGRGGEQSYCILMSDYKLSKESKQRIDTMVRTHDGFEIAEMDLKLRGPGDLMGTQQSGLLDLLIADIAKDQKILEEARAAAQALLRNDPDLTGPENANIKRHVDSLRKNVVNWSKVS